MLFIVHGPPHKQYLVPPVEDIARAAEEHLQRAMEAIFDFELYEMG